MEIYEVVAPPWLSNRFIDEVPSLEPSQLVGRVFETTLGEIIEDLKYAHIKLYFRVREVEKNRALTDFLGHEVTSEYLEQKKARFRSSITDDCAVETKDGRRLRISYILMILEKFRNPSFDEAVRKHIRKFVVSLAREKKFDDFMLETVLEKLSADIFRMVMRLYFEEEERTYWKPFFAVEVFKTEVDPVLKLDEEKLLTEWWGWKPVSIVMKEFELTEYQIKKAIADGLVKSIDVGGSSPEEIARELGISVSRAREYQEKLEKGDLSKLIKYKDLVLAFQQLGLPHVSYQNLLMKNLK
jgi:small subunit ribosomal protein S3Ae